MTIEILEGLSIEDALKKIRQDKIVLPALQREFVWDPSQIENLFDSILQGFPIGAFIFWEYSEKYWNDKSERFYEFVKELSIDKRNKGNKIETEEMNKSTLAVIDGQQRLTSFYIGLHSFCRTEVKEIPVQLNLYLNLKLPEAMKEENPDYASKSKIKRFSFKTDESANEENDAFVRNGEPRYWFHVKDIHDIKDSTQARAYLLDNNFVNNSQELQDAKEIIDDLRDAIKQPLLANKISHEDTMFILESFIRLNQSGEDLSNIDFLFSVITKQWQKKSGSECIEALINGMKEICDLGFNKQAVLNACLAIVGQPVNLAVENFGKEVTDKMEEDWGKIVLSLLLTVKILKDFGFHDAKTLGPKKAILCIVATYVAEAINPGEHMLSDEQKKLFDDDTKPIYREDMIPTGFFRKDYKTARDQLRNFVYQAALAPIKTRSDDYKFNYWGTANDTKLNIITQTIRDENVTPESFPAQKISENLEREGHPFVFESAHIHRLMRTQKDDKLAFPTLALLFQSSLKLNEAYDKDHIWPTAKMKKTALKEAKVPDSEIPSVIDRRDTLANLQLLTQEENRKKLDQLPHEWLKGLDEGSATVFRTRHYLDPALDGKTKKLPSTQKGFKDWMDQRSRVMQTELAKIFGLKKFEPAEWSETE